MIDEFTECGSPSHIRQLRCIRSYLEFTAACTIATAIVHATSIPAILFTTTCLSILWLPASNSWNSACVVVKPPKSCHITPMLWCLHWFKITECIEYNCCNLLKSSQPPNVYICSISSVFNLLAALALHLLSLDRPPTSSSLCMTDCSFR